MLILETLVVSQPVLFSHCSPFWSFLWLVIVLLINYQQNLGEKRFMSSLSGFAQVTFKDFMLHDFGNLHIIEEIVYDGTVSVAHVDKCKLPVGFLNIDVGEWRVTFDKL